jgi:hypothetical protein
MSSTVVVEEPDAHGLSTHDGAAVHGVDCSSHTCSAGSAEFAGAAEAGRAADASSSAPPATEGAGGEATQATCTAASTDAELVRLPGQAPVLLGVAENCLVM